MLCRTKESHDEFMACLSPWNRKAVILPQNDGVGHFSQTDGNIRPGHLALWDRPPSASTICTTTAFLCRREQQTRAFRSVCVCSPPPYIPNDCAHTMYHISWDSWGLLGTRPGQPTWALPAVWSITASPQKNLKLPMLAKVTRCLTFQRPCCTSSTAEKGIAMGLLWTLCAYRCDEPVPLWILWGPGARVHVQQRHGQPLPGA